MKIRQGFVSNSSSSSFVLKKSESPDIYDLAQLMVMKRGWDNDDQLCKDLRAGQKNKILTPDMGITFQTCNYDTYIFPILDYLAISTCHNHDFSSDFPAMNELHFKTAMKELVKMGMPCFEDVENGDGGCLWEELGSGHIKYIGKWWVADCGAIGTFPCRMEGPRRDYPTQRGMCEKGDWHSVIKLDSGSIFCSDCWRDKHIWKRGDKK